MLSAIRDLMHRVGTPFTPKVNSVSSAYGIELADNPTDWTFKFYVRGSYGFYLSDYLKTVSEPFIFLDIGANQGLYAILAALNPNCHKVYAFEPIETVAAFMAHNVRLNRCRNVEIVQAAVSDKIGRTRITVREGHSGAASLLGINGRNPDQPSHEVEIRTINSQALGRLVKKPNARVIVKIDVEGHEEVVINQLLQCGFFNQVTDVFYECNENWISPERIKERLVARGFDQFDKIGDGKHYDVHARKS